MVVRPRKEPAMPLQSRVTQLPVSINDLPSKSSAKNTLRVEYINDDDLHYLEVDVVHAQVNTTSNTLLPI